MSTPFTVYPSNPLNGSQSVDLPQTNKPTSNKPLGYDDLLNSWKELQRVDHWRPKPTPRNDYHGLLVGTPLAGGKAFP